VSGYREHQCVRSALACRATSIVANLSTAPRFQPLETAQRVDSRSCERASVPPAVLQTLRRGPQHGYALAHDIKGTSGDLLQIEEDSLYPTLQRMLKAGWVNAEWGVSARNRKVRLYKIPPAGRRQLEREVSSFERMFKGVSRVMRPAQS